MNRPETTASLSELVMKKLTNEYAFWAAEVNLDAYKKRVDFVGYNPSKNGSFANVADIESGTFDFYEVKSSMADFNSGHGKNWEGDKNFLVCERELANELHQKMLLPQNIAVLCPNKPRTALIRVHNMMWSSSRKKSSSELLWNMICARDSRYIKKIEGSGDE